MAPVDDRAPSQPPSARLLELTMQAQITFHAIWVATELGIPDRIGSETRNAEEIAGPLGLHAPSVYRLLRALTVSEVCHEAPGRRFRLTPIGELLRRDTPDSMRDWVLFVGSPFRLAAWQELPYSVRTGKPSFDKAHGLPTFDFLASHPEEAAIFDAAMTSSTLRTANAIAEAYDFSSARTVADIGGGQGVLLATILERNPGLRGVLFDLPHAMEGARQAFAAKHLSDRVDAVVGSFFERVPSGADVYLLKSIIHDWDDDRCVAILRLCREAMAPGGRVLVVEGIVPPPNHPSFRKLLDLEMLALPGGMERTEDEYRALLERAGLRLSRIVPTASPASLLEGVPEDAAKRS